MRRIMIALAALTLLTACEPDNVTSAVDELTLRYLDAEIYDPVACRSKDVQDRWFVRCVPSTDRSLPGGLFRIVPVDGQITILASNGRASQHMRRFVGLDCGADRNAQTTASMRLGGNASWGCDTDLSIQPGDILDNW